jgi:hypothetical protein
MIPYQTND